MSRRQSKQPPGSSGAALPGQPKVQLPFTSPDVDDADFSSQTGESSTANTKPQPISSPPRPTSSTGGYLSSSFTRTPARSFYHQATHGSIDTPEYSSQGLRDKTQELSMHALSESGSFRSPSVLARHLSGSGSPRGRRSSELPYNYHNDTSDFESGGGGRDSLDIPIEEESEPSSPEPLHKVIPERLPRPKSASSTAGKLPSAAVAVNGGPDLPHHDPRRSSGDRHGTSETSSLLPKKAMGARPRSRKHYGATNTSSDVEDQRHGLRSRPAQFWHRVSHTAHEAVESCRRVANPKSWDSMILFPLGEPIFAKLGVDGLSMFFVSCIVSQLVYSLGGSTFKGAVGSEMIEVVPFFHKMTYVIMARMGEAEPNAIIATVVLAYAVSSIITGLIFLVLGLFKLGDLVSFFPRNILNGCIGGVGFFLFVTGIEVSARLDGNLEYNLVTLHKLFQADTIALWVSPLALAIIYMVIKHYYDHPALMPAFIVLITGVFHIIVAGVSHFNLDKARHAGWVFDKPESGVPFYHFYSLYDFSVVDWSALLRTIPTMFALSFFGIIHVPINVPALALSAKEDDVDINRELIAHGLSNGLSGFVGSIQNYLVYVNSVMFMDHGGNSRMAGLLLAAATTGIWMAGPGLIGYVPIMVVGTLIFYLGLDLLKEALWDTLGRLRLLEYLTIITIVLIMGIYDFVWGVLAGIVLACLTYVVQTSRTPVIRSTYTGAIAQSTVRRPPLHQKYLREVGQQIYVAKIAGYLFFGTIVSVENDIRKLVDEEQFRTRPIRYVVLDLVHVIGIDYSAAEVLVRLNRILHRRNVTLVLSSISLNDEVGQGLSMVGLFAPAESNDEHCPPPQRFETLNKALEWCENELLGTLHERARSLGSPKEAEPVSISPPKPGNQTNPFDVGAFNSPRRALLQEAATLALKDQKNVTVDEHSNVLTPDKWKNFAQPIPLMLLTFQDLSDKDIDFWHRATPYFERREFPAGTVLYSRGDVPDGFYLVEKGSLRADYYLEQGHYYESIQAGTTCGELPFFSETDRTGNVVAETETVAWLLTRGKWNELERKQPEVASELLRICLKLTSERMNAITS
ncbi:Sulfate transporter family protein [Neofusicoccum parvum]|nr:Sulfate transporter family protein [Neofusicoccum parvum]